MCSDPAGLASVRIRSYVTPSAHVEGFEKGKEFPLTLLANSTLEELLYHLFRKNRDHIGFKVVNGKVVKDKVLTDGDLIEIYSLMGGG